MDRFQELRTFVAVAETGGFAKAAARMGSSPPAVTRMIASLEARLGIQLFNRTTRNVRLTDAGLRFAERARVALTALEAAENEAHDSYSFVMDGRVFTGDTPLIRGTGRTDFQKGCARAQYDNLHFNMHNVYDGVYSKKFSNEPPHSRTSVRGCGTLS